MGGMFPSQTSSSDNSKSCLSNESRACGDRGVSSEIGGNGRKTGRGAGAGDRSDASACIAFREALCADRVITSRNFWMAGGAFRCAVANDGCSDDGDDGSDDGTGGDGLIFSSVHGGVSVNANGGNGKSMTSLRGSGINFVFTSLIIMFIRT